MFFGELASHGFGGTAPVSSVIVFGKVFGAVLAALPAGFAFGAAAGFAAAFTGAAFAAAALLAVAGLAVALLASSLAEAGLAAVLPFARPAVPVAFATRSSLARQLCITDYRPACKLCTPACEVGKCKRAKGEKGEKKTTDI
jgi:hypothetical protein